MVDILYDLVAWMLSIPPLYAYLVILAITYGENLFPPIPGDVIVVFGGYMAGMGLLDVWLVVVTSSVGAILGFMTVYLVGYYLGDAVFDRRRWRWIPKRQVRRVRAWLHRWGYGVVIANRLLSGARSVVSLSVGISRMNPWKIALYASISALVWMTMLALTGRIVGSNWDMVIEYLGAYGRIVLIVLALVIAYFIVRRIRKRRSGTREVAAR